MAGVEMTADEVKAAAAEQLARQQGEQALAEATAQPPAWASNTYPTLQPGEPNAPQPVTDGVPAALAAPPAEPAPAPPQALAAPEDPNAEIRRYVPGFGTRPTDPDQVFARSEAAHGQISRDLNKSEQLQAAGAADTLKAETADAQAHKDAADAKVLEGNKMLKAMDTNQTEQGVIQAKAEADLNNDIEEHKKMYAANPHDWWANHSSVSKVGAILSMVGAGLAGRDPSEVLDKLVSKDTAEAARKEGVLDKIGASQKAMANLRMQGSREKLTNLQARHLAGMQIVSDQLEGRIASTGDMRAKSNYETLQGAVKERIAKLKSSEISTRAQEANMAGGRQQFYDNIPINTKLKEDALAAKAAAAGHTGGGAPLVDFDGSGTFKGILGKVTDFLAPRQSAVEGLQSIRNILKDNKKGVRNSAIDYQKIKIIQANLEGIIRKVQGTGANLSKEEKENVDKLKGMATDYVAGKVTGYDLSEQMKITQQSFSHQAVDYVNEATPDGKRNEPKKDSVWGRVLAEEGSDREAGLHFDEKVRAILNSGGSDKHILDQLQEESDKGNFAAQSALIDLKKKQGLSAGAPSPGYVYN